MLSFLDPVWIRATGPGEFWFVAAVLWSLAVFALAHGLRHWLRLRAIADIPRSLIRSAAQGQVELEGQAKLMPGPPIVAPLSGMRCLWWSYTIHGPSNSTGSFEGLESDASGELFLLDDGSGQCVIDPDGAEVYASVTDVWHGATPTPEGGPHMSAGGGYTYTEHRINEGDALRAQGYFHTQGPVSSADIDEEVRQQLAEWKRDQTWLIQHFDANHDGQVDQQEWEAARQEARHLVLERERENLKRPPVNVLGRARDGRALVLSTTPRQKLRARLQLHMWAGLLAFICLGAAATHMLSVRFSAAAPVTAPMP